jgi:hypothetical protein
VLVVVVMAMDHGGEVGVLTTLAVLSKHVQALKMASSSFFSFPLRL